MPEVSVEHVSGAPSLSVDGERRRVLPPTPMEAVAAVRSLMERDLGLSDDWWEPLFEPLCTRWMEYDTARRVLDEAAREAPASRVRVTTAKPRLWTSQVLPGGLVLDLRPSRNARAVVEALRGPGRGDLFKFLGADLPLRRAGSWGRARGAARRVPWLGLIEVPTPSMSENLLRIGERLPMDVLSCDPRAASASVARGLTTHNLWGRGPGAAAESVGGRMVSAMTQADPAFAAAVGPGVRRLADHLAADRLRLRAWLEELRPTTLVLSSDQHRFGVLATWEARRIGAKSIVVQHGFADHPLGYLPVRADVVAAIGPTSRDWFVRNGTDASSVVATGSPRFPELRPFTRGRLDRRVLVPLNGNAVPSLRELLAAASSLAAQGHELALRPHPGDRHLHGLGAEALLAAYGVPSMANVVVDDEPDVHRSLSRSGLVLNWDSSVLYEALCLGVPVALYHHGETAPNPSARSGLPLFSTGKDLLDLAGPTWRGTIDACHEARSELVTAGDDSAVEAIAQLAG